MRNIQVLAARTLESENLPPIWAYFLGLVDVANDA